MFFSNSMIINFAGIDGKIVGSSPHGNYLIVQLTNRVTIIGTYSNKWNWEEVNEFESRFISFITYIGIKDNEELEKYHKWIEENNGYFGNDDESCRPSKRIRGFAYEMKVRGLSVESVLNLLSI